MPETYNINDHNWPSVLTTIAEKYYIKDNLLMDKVDNINWILKPSLLNNGQYIKIFSQIHQVEKHYLNPRRLGG